MTLDGPGTGQLTAAVRQVLPSVRSGLDRLIRIPSVSADPAAAAHVRASAGEVAALLRGAGLADVEVVAVDGGQPAVLGRRPAPPGAPTVLLYAHHDVQPAGDPATWDSDPFEPAERGGRLYGRGTADDKAGIAVHLAALAAHGSELPVGVTVLIEGEEEIGSPTVSEFLTTYADRVRADVVVLADGANWTADVPALTTSLRGGVNVTVEVRTLSHGVHSGMYGGPVPDALTALCRLLATLHDEHGDVAVAGLTGGAAGPADLTEAQLRADAGVLDGVRLIGTGSLTQRLWARPAIAVIGIDAPAVAAASNTLIPAARALVSMRVAPGDDPARACAALAAHLRSRAPWGAHVTVQPGRAVAPYAISTGGAAHRAAHAALAEAWGTPAVDIGVGGSISLVSVYAALVPDAQILITGVADPDTRAHGANESLDLATFERACLAEALLLRNIAETGERR
jgi:acetylornithine deacetylase/succinyl-diaminopimelate desuccinylase-like protein